MGACWPWDGPKFQEVGMTYQKFTALLYIVACQWGLCKTALAQGRDETLAVNPLVHTQLD